NQGTATLTNVTVEGNTAKTGGGIRHSGAGSQLSLTNVTISGNTAATLGGGLQSQSATAIVNSTIAFNTGQNGAGLNISGGGTLTLLNSIVASNTRSNLTTNNVSGNVASLGYNISSDGTASLSAAGDQSGVDPQLAALASN